MGRNFYFYLKVFKQSINLKLLTCQHNDLKTDYHITGKGDYFFYYIIVLSTNRFRDNLATTTKFRDYN